MLAHIQDLAWFESWLAPAAAHPELVKGPGHVLRAARATQLSSGVRSAWLGSRRRQSQLGLVWTWSTARAVHPANGALLQEDDAATAVNDRQGIASHRLSRVRNGSQFSKTTRPGPDRVRLSTCVASGSGISSVVCGAPAPLHITCPPMFQGTCFSEETT